jgi:hypothetical protein
VIRHAARRHADRGGQIRLFRHSRASAPSYAGIGVSNLTFASNNTGIDDAGIDESIDDTPTDTLATSPIPEKDDQGILRSASAQASS